MRRKNKFINLKDARYGDIIFFKPFTISGKIITWIDGSPYSHTAIYWGKLGGEHFVFEAQRGRSIGLTKLQNWRNFIIVRPKQKICSQKKLMSVEGNGYQTNKLLAIALNKCFGLALEADDPTCMICSELVNWAYDYSLGEKGNCTPASLFDELQ